MRGALQSILMLVLAFNGEAYAGTPSYERVVTWAPKDNLFVKGDWYHWGGEGVMTTPPNRYYVRSLLTGATLGTVDCEHGQAKMCGPTGGDCQAPFAAPTCDWPDVAKGTPWAKTAFGHKGEQTQGLLTVKHERSGTYLAVAGGAKKGRLLWLNRSEWKVSEIRRAAGELFVVIVAEYDNGLPVHEEELLRFPVGDLAAERLSPTRQARVLGLAQRLGFPAYRTAAELAPIPRDVLSAALCAAEGQRREDLGVLWFRRATRGMPAAQIETFTAEVLADACLSRTRKLLY
jgi:hypothetical protein